MNYIYNQVTEEEEEILDIPTIESPEDPLEDGE